MEENNVPPVAISLSGLSVEFCKILVSAPSESAVHLLEETLRYLPRIFLAVNELNPYGDGNVLADADNLNTDMISATVTEEQYNDVRQGLAALLGEFDMYLDTPVEDMRFSDTPVAVSLSEQLTDIFQVLADFAATLCSASSVEIPDILAELKYRFVSYLSETLCSALKAANFLYQSKALQEE